VIPSMRADEVPTARDLLLQALLHLPRIADPDGTIESTIARGEIERLRASRRAELAPLRSLARPPTPRPRLDDLEVRLLDPSAVAPVLGHFHYLRSFREDGVSVGALHQGRIVAVCTVSPLDLPSVAQSLPVAATKAAVISRMFAFDWAPRNTISYLLARTEDCRPAVHEDVRMLVTYVNPNLGFSGASYKAANWLPLGLEIGTRYAYRNARYVTDRQLENVPSGESAGIEYSKMPLRPLVLLCRLLDRRLQRAHPNGFDFVVAREGTQALAGARH
jgi:hypothetical protein